ncbi:MAG: EamA family transporter [Bacteroidota bacterium]
MMNGKLLLAFTAVYFGWGSTYLAIMFALESFPPFLLAGIRFFIAGCLLFGWCRLKKESLPSFKDLVKIAFTGICLLFFGSGSVIWVEQYLSSSLTSIIWATLPMWLILLDKERWRIHLSNYKIIFGLALGFIGVMVLFGDKKLLIFSDDPMQLVSVWIALLGTIIFAVGSLYAKSQALSASPTLRAAIQMMIAGILSILIGFLVNEQQEIILMDVSTSGFISLLYLIVVGSLMAYLAYVWLINKISPAIVGTYTYVNPLVATFLGWAVLQEVISLQQITALIIILIGVMTVNFSKLKIS